MKRKLFYNDAINLIPFFFRFYDIKVVKNLNGTNKIRIRSSKAHNSQNFIFKNSYKPISSIINE